jgi:hypothetical protein
MDRKAGNLLILLSTLLWGCVKDKPTPPTTGTGATGSVYIVCEGSLSNGNATLYLYNPQTDSVFGDVYRAVNNQALGDVFQSMVRIGDSLYLCINNSDKITVLNKGSHTLAGTIQVAKPRYILPVRAGLAWVSTLFSNRLYAIDPQNQKVLHITELPGQNPEAMCLHMGSLYVCPWDTAVNAIYQLNAETGQLLHTIRIGGYAPHSILVDKEQMLWVLSGNVTKGRQAAWTRIDPSTGNILKTYTFAAGTDPVKPVLNNSRDTLYYIQVKYDGTAANNGVYRMPITATELPTTPFVAGAAYQYYWALGIEPGSGHIYLADPKGFVQKGMAHIYRPDGTLLRSFATGLGPGQFNFDR